MNHLHPFHFTPHRSTTTPTGGAGGGGQGVIFSDALLAIVEYAETVLHAGSSAAAGPQSAAAVGVFFFQCVPLYIHVSIYLCVCDVCFLNVCTFCL